MRPNSTVDSLAQSSQLAQRSATAEKARLHPTLSGALANLDIQLEEELARYRRQRLGSGRLPQQTNRKPSTKALDLISISATSSQAPPRSTASLSDQPSLAGSSAPAGAPPTGESRTLSEMVVASQAIDLANLAASGAAAQEGLTEPPNTARLDDYLESSEELLRSLAEEEARVQAERGFMRNLMTPLGVGSMLLLLLSSAMFGYVVMNPSSLSQLFAAKEAADSPTATTEGAGTAADAPEPNLANQEFKDLNLDTLGTLKGNRSSSGARPAPANPSAAGSPTLGTRGTTATSAVPKSGQPASQPNSAEAPSPPAASSSPVTTMRTYSPPEPALPARSTVAPRAVAPVKPASPSPAPAAVKPAPAAPVPPPPAAAPSSSPSASPSSRASSAESYQYKVVTPYDGDRTLETVKQSVPDAFIRNSESGANIQVGAYKDSAEAEAQVQKLREQGISAEVQKR